MGVSLYMDKKCELTSHQSDNKLDLLRPPKIQLQFHRHNHHNK